MPRIPGIHHVTAIAGDPQRNVDYYVGTLGLRLVKKTVNFDEPGTYHLYYGDRRGSPGSILTFFPFANAGRGRAGPGMASAVAFAVPKGGLDAWMARLAEDAVDFEGPRTRFDETVITLRDPDGLTVELVERQGAAGDGAATIDSIDGVSLCLQSVEPTARLLTDLFGYREVGGDGDRLRFRAGDRAGLLDLRAQTERLGGAMGAGSVHHVAFRAADTAEQEEWRALLADAGYSVTPIIDRQYFHAIYFREPGGVLFEIATDPPGFATDESEAELGTSLKLPQQYEPMRAQIERRLAPVRVPDRG